MRDESVGEYRPGFLYCISTPAQWPLPYYFTYSTFAGLPGLYLEDLFVKPDVRGQGVGRELLRHLAKLAIQEGCFRIEWAVLHWNKSAIGFYERLGAVPMNEWAVYRLTGPALSRLAEEDH